MCDSQVVSAGALVSFAAMAASRSGPRLVPTSYGMLWKAGAKELYVDLWTPTSKWVLFHLVFSTHPCKQNTQRYREIA